MALQRNLVYSIFFANFSELSVIQSFNHRNDNENNNILTSPTSHTVRYFVSYSSPFAPPPPPAHDTCAKMNVNYDRRSPDNTKEKTLSNALYGRFRFRHSPSNAVGQHTSREFSCYGRRFEWRKCLFRLRIYFCNKIISKTHDRRSITGATARRPE